MDTDTSRISLVIETKRLLRQLGTHARKGLGQNFLVDAEALKTILESAEIEEGDAVIEVGPGLGILTRELAKRAGRVIAVELDGKLAAALRRSMADNKNVEIINRDVLDVEPCDLLAGGQRYKLVANIPYYITSPVLRHFLEARLKPSLMVLMVQKEVAQAITAGPGDMSILAVSIRYYGSPEIVSLVPAESFYPPPEVDSAILKVKVFSKPIVDVDETVFFEMVRAGFCAARKQIANSLAQGLKVPRADILTLLEKAGIDPRRRAETLTVEEWAKLSREWE